MRTINLVLRAQVLTIVLITILAAGACTTTPIARTLDVYFVDVEGGQATLFIMPDGETLLFDAGYPGQGKSDPTPGDARNARDPQRILAAAKDANISRIDYLLISHFHTDHFGGTMELAELIPIGTIIDRGTGTLESPVKPSMRNLLDAYETVREQQDILTPVVGERLPLDGVEITVVSSGGEILESQGEKTATPIAACDRPVLTAGVPTENQRSLGILLRYGEFRFLDLGDLGGQTLSDLVCPGNRIGSIDVYLVPHHGGVDSADPATLAAFRPRVAILNNGATKGGAAPIFDVLRDAQGLEDVWQLHRAETEGAENFAPERIANLDTQTENWIKLSAKPDGSFRVFNGRTGEWKSYDVR